MGDDLLRLYVTGRVAAERRGKLVDEARFASRQTRLLFARLVLERSRAASREELAELFWAEEPPAAWDASLKSVVSKLRSALDVLGKPTGARIVSHYGCYELVLPSSTWVDWEAAAAALDESEGALRRGDPRGAWGPANVALVVARRGFLPGERGGWAEAKRRELDAMLARAADAYTDACLATAQAESAVPIAEEAIAREPFRETSYQRLMKAHASLGNRAEALRVYHRCRDLLREELGVSPSPETESVYLELLKKTET